MTQPALDSSPGRAIYRKNAFHFRDRASRRLYAAPGWFMATVRQGPEDGKAGRAATFHKFAVSSDGTKGVFAR